MAQCVVIEDKRGFDALARSGQLVRDNWWRVFGIVLVTQLLAAIPAILISAPVQRGRGGGRPRGDRAGRARWWPASSTAPLVAIVTTLLFYDLRDRRARANLLARASPFQLAPPVLLAEHELLGQRRARRR